MINFFVFVCNTVLITTMSKPESVLIIDPAQELKFKGEFGDEKAFVKKRVVFLNIKNFHPQKTTSWSQNCAIYAVFE